MRKGFLGSISALFTGAGLTLAQAPAPVAAPAPVPAAPAIVAAPAGPGCASGNCSGVGPACCGEVCDACPQVCGPDGRIWASAEYLLWWIREGNVPPLVTAGPPGSAAVVGAPGTTILYGGNVDNGSPYSGGRFTVGGWLDDCQTVGIEGNYLFLGSRSRQFHVGSAGAPGTPTLAVPFLDVTGAPAVIFENSDIAALAGVSTGTIDVNSSSRLNGAELNGLCNVLCGCSGRLDVIGGFRYLQLDEDLGIVENSTLFPGVPVIGGTNLVVADQFDTRNRFYGGQLGLRGEARRGNFFVNGRGLLALGVTHQSVTINGATAITTPAGVTANLAGGNLALPTNIGHYRRDVFGFLPELGVNVGYQLLPNLRAFVGYTFLYWSDVVRPGDQIDRAVNTTQSPVNLAGPGALVGVARPAFTFRDTDFWAQGANFGVEFRY